MLGVRVGEAAPEFALTCVGTLNATPRPVRLRDYCGRWLALIFYPRDFSFVCPTELTAFSARLTDFNKRDCELLGISVDSIQLHHEWLTTPTEEGGLGPLQFPLASDPDGTVARAFGVWVDEKQVSTRGLFIIDPDGVLQYAVAHNLSVGRDPDEVLRVLGALQTGGLCPASWTSADGTIDPEAALQPGRILGHYRIRERLGGGTFGTVFAAWDLRLERMVALKVLKRNVLESREAVLNEARVVAKLNHPHVCTIYAVEEQDGLPVIAMEYLDGRPLSQTTLEGLGPHLALKFAIQIALGLAAAHEQGVVHGDLKPANIIVTDERTAKILDFGLAQSQRPSSPPGADRKGTRLPAAPPDAWESDAEATAVYATSGAGDVCTDGGEAAVIEGTPAYMSPEQAMGLSVTPASDVFSFGLTLFEMLTGRRALSEQAPLKLLLQLQTQDLAPKLVPHVEEPLQELLAVMLTRDASERATVAEVVERLASIHSHNSKT